MKSVKPATKLTQPTHNRCRRHHPNPRTSNLNHPNPTQITSNPHQIRHRTMHKHIPHREHHTSRTSPTHQLNRNNTVPTQREKVIINPHPGQAQHLSEHITHNLFLRCPWPPPSPCPPKLRN